jgi:signal transduction histidine kinase
VDPVADVPRTGRPRRRRAVAVLAVVLVVVLGVTGTALASYALHRMTADRAARTLAQQAVIVANAVSAEVTRYRNALTDLAASVGAQARLEASEFDAITAPLGDHRLPGATGVGFVVPSDTRGVRAVQAVWRGRGVPGLTLRPVPAANDEHMLVVLNRPLDGQPSTAGRDLAASHEIAEALRTARARRTAAVSTTYRLLKDADLPAARQQLSFAMAAPVFATSSAAPDRGAFRGWLVMGLRGNDFLHRTIGDAAGDAVAVTLADGGVDQPIPVASWRPRTRLDTALAPLQVPIVVPHRSWELSVAPTVRMLPDPGLPLEVLAGLVGVVITALLAALTATLATSRDRAVRRVAQATAALHDDIARRKAVETRLRRREQELVGFAGMVAHDLRSPLARITGYADFLREEATGRLDPQHRDYLQRVSDGAWRMQALVDELLDYATAENRVLARRPVDLGALAAAVTAERAAEQTVRVAGLPVVEGDPVLLRQVLDNLIGNALKYADPDVPADVAVTARRDPAGGWRIDVADRGIGVPVEHRESMFDAFRRAPGTDDIPGTGLGLAIVQRIVVRHGGRAGLEENPGGGTRAWFWLPDVRSPATTGVRAAVP